MWTLCQSIFCLVIIFGLPIAKAVWTWRILFSKSKAASPKVNPQVANPAWLWDSTLTDNSCWELVSITREKWHIVNLSVIDVVSKSLLSGDHPRPSYHQSCLDLASPLFQVGSCKPQKPRSQKPRSPEPRSPKAMHHLKRLLIHPESDS